MGLAIAWFFWSRPGRGIAILGTVLSLGFVPLTLIAVTGGLNVGPLYIAVAAVGFACFITSAYSWWLFTRRVEPRAS